MLHVLYGERGLMEEKYILQTVNLRKWFPVQGGLRKRYVKAVNGVSLKVRYGETLGIVG